MATYHCSKCGRTAVTLSGARLSLDDRYAVGWCHSCDPDGTGEPRPFVRDDMWDQAALDAAKDAKRKTRLIRDFTAGRIRKGSDRYREAEALMATAEASR